jgi:uncharacterized protein (TIGR00290 family)
VLRANLSTSGTLASADRAVVSWSGGKDSCLAAHLAAEQGLRIAALLCMVEPAADRSRSHALPSWILHAQARAIGCDLELVPAGWPDYEQAFVTALTGLHAQGVREAIFGDIDLQPHREWEEKVCARAGIAARLPLWEWPRERVVEEILGRGIEAVCVCVNTRFLGAEFCGRPYDKSFVADLPAGVDACGENGEFHTCVTRAPLLRTAIPVRVTGRERYIAPPDQGSAEFWFARLAEDAAAPLSH